jgi:hypothetical protein
MLWMLSLAWFAARQTLEQAPPTKAPVNVATLSISAPAIVAEVDAGKLKGECRELAWSPDGTQLYLQTAEGKPPMETLHHYTLALPNGAPVAVHDQPAWAVEYWSVKQDRSAPGLPAVSIKVEQKQETLKAGVGTAGVLDRQSNPTSVAANNPSAESLAGGIHGDQKANVVRLRLLDQEIAVWVNERAIPGTRFSWGPAGSGALVFVGENGQLVLFDLAKHKKKVPGVKDAWLPAWSADGSRLAYLQKTGRKKFVVAWVAVRPS